MSGIKRNTEKKKYDNNFIAIYNAVSEDVRFKKGLSGGDRIFIELTKKWKDLFRSYKIITCTSGEFIIRKYIKDFGNIIFNTIKVSSSSYRNILKLYLLKTVKSLYVILNQQFQDKTILFTSSDFLPDVLPATYAKMRNNNIKWIAAFYFFAASPSSPEFPYQGLKQSLRGSFYYFTQKIAYYLIKKFSDFVILCNEIDKKVFINDGYPSNKIWVIYGGVDLPMVAKILASHQRYDAVYQARFHPQKGPMMAVKAWEEVIKVKPGFKLAMIGSGPLEKELINYIKQKKLSENIHLLGFLDGEKKYAIFKGAKIFLHTSIYETGGMSPAEGMAAGLPVIAFDHPGFDYCYPKGMIRVSPVGDFQEMARKILYLFKNKKEYERLKYEALEFVKEWDWNSRALILLERIDYSMRK